MSDNDASHETWNMIVQDETFSERPRRGDFAVYDDPAQAALVQEGKEFTVVLDRKCGENLGIDVDRNDGLALIIESLEQGLVKDWNRKLPAFALQKGDRILAVNDVRGAEAMIAQCQVDQLIKLQVVRPIRWS